MTTPELDAVVLPPLPEWMLDDGITTLADFELRDHMGSYATAAVLADRERRVPAQAVGAAIDAAMNESPPTGAAP